MKSQLGLFLTPRPLQVSKAVEKLGGIAQCVTSRESVLFFVDVLRENSLAALDILSNVILNPTITEEDISECKKVMMYQQNEFPGEVLSRDAVMLAAYSGSPLSNHHICPEDKVESINLDMVQRFRDQHFIAENMVISAAGIDHDSLVAYVEKRFASCRSVGQAAHKQLKAEKKSSIYTGGKFTNQRELKEPFIKVALGYEIGGWHDSQFVPACVLQQLLGGGSSFSAGGPGKGMYTRLYTQLLNKHYWVESADAFVLVHNETGILGIDGACMPEHAMKMVQALLDHLVRLAFEDVSDEELSRAKNMLRSMMMMQLESRLVVCEDIARQVSTYGHRELPHDVGERIQRVTKEDLRKVAIRMMKSKPVLGCVGSELSQIPAYDELERVTEPIRRMMAKAHK
jgi:mitochondrial-processing peptidase subunit alpha